MRENLLKKQPTWGLRRAQGTGQKSATPATLTKVILVLLTTFLLPSAAWSVEVIKTIQFNKNVDDVTNSIIPVSVSEDVGGTRYTYNSNVYIRDDNAIEQYSSSEQGGAVFKVNNDATSDMSSIIIIIPGNYPIVPTMVKLKFKYANAIGDTDNPDDDYNAIIHVCDYNTSDTQDLRYKTTESNLDKTTNPLIFTAGGESVTVGGETITVGGGTDRKDGPKSLWIMACLDGNPNPETEEDRTTFTITEVEITYDINESDVYGLTVAGVPVTRVNKSAVFFDKDITDWDENEEKYTGTVSFTPAEGDTPATLTLNEAALKVSTEGGAAIESSLSNLVVNLVGENNTITSTATTSYAFKGNGSNTIKFQTDVQNPGKIQGNIPKANVFNNNITPSYQGLDLAGDDQGFTIGVIEYGLTIGGVAVTSANLNTETDAISGLNNVFFSPAKVVVDQSGSNIPATLTLKGATINGKIEWNSSDNLTIALNGKNTIESKEGGELFKSENTCTLNIVKADNAESATLKYASYSESGGKITNATTYFSKFSPITPGEGFNRTPFTVQVDGINYNYYTTEVYPVTVAGRQVHNISGEPGYRENILGDGKVSFTPAEGDNPHTLTLNGATINGQIKMIDYGNLILHFVGENTITIESADVYDYAIQGYNSTGTLEFSTSNNKTDILTIVGIENDNHIVYGWLKAPSISTTGYTADWAVVSTGNTHHISKNNKYDLWINGERFCDTNLAPYSGIAFDPGTSTLTYAYTDPDHVIYSGLTSLTIKMGNSQLKAIVFGSPDTGQPITATSGNLSIVKYSDDSSVELEPFKLVGDGTNSVISGFTGVTYDDYLILEDGVSYNTESKQLENTSKEAAKSAVFVSATLEKPMMKNLDGVLSIINNNSYDPNQDTSGDEIQIGTIKYSIEYSDGSEGVTDALFNESNAPTLDKAAIVTAYVQLNGVTSESATGKYLEAKQKVFGVAIGDKIEGTDWFTPSVSNDEVTFFFDGSKSNGIFEEENEKLIAKKSGTGKVEVNYEGENILNNPPITLTINVGEELSDYFEVSNNFGTFYNTDQTTTYAVPEGMKAYVITGADPETGKVTTAETTVLPPNTPVLLEKGSAKAFNYIPTTSGTAPSGNILLYTGNTDVEATDGSNLYVLYNDKFVKVTTDTRILSQKCYLDLSSLKSSGTRSYYDIDGSDGTTALREVKSEGVKGEKWNDGEWYTLQGRKFTTKPTKPGLYILNGKKVVIK